MKFFNKKYWIILAIIILAIFVPMLINPIEHCSDIWIGNEPAYCWGTNWKMTFDLIFWFEVVALVIWHLIYAIVYFVKRAKNKKN